MQNLIIKNKNTTHSGPFDIITKICIFLLLLTLTNKDLGNFSSLVYWGIVFGCLGLLTLRLCMLKKNVVITAFIWWYLIFFIVCIASLLYSVNSSYSIENLKNIFVNAAVLICLAWMIETKADLNAIIKILILVTVCNAVYLCLVVDWSYMGVERLDAKEIGVGWNSNEIGIMMLWGTMLCCYLAKEFKKAKYYLFIPLFLTLIIYSGSRTVWIGFIVFLMAFIWIINKKHIFIGVLISIIVLTVIIALLMNVETLYNIGGKRLEEFFEGFFGTGKYDSSAALRDRYINYGWGWFLENPIFGHGINTYRHLLHSVMGRTTYAHNNLIELLVAVGMFGTVVYYYIYYMISKMAFNLIFIKRVDNSFSAYILVTTIMVQVLMHYGSVQYSDIYSLLLIMLVFYYFRLQTKKSEGDISEKNY